MFTQPKAKLSKKKRSFDEMTPVVELLQELQAREERIAKLESECQRLKKKTKASSEPPVSAAKVSPVQQAADPAKVQAAADKLAQIAARGIKSQMKWKASCKHGIARWSWASLCDEPTFRAFMGLKGAEKTKGGKVPVDAFQDMLGVTLSTSIRYGSLHLRNDTVNITYKKDSGEIKITGAYGM